MNSRSRRPEARKGRPVDHHYLQAISMLFSRHLRCVRHTDSNGQRRPQRHPRIVHAQRQAAYAQKSIATLQLIWMSRSIDYMTIKSDCNFFTAPKVILWLLLAERLFLNVVRCHLVRLGLPLSQIATVRDVAARDTIK